MRVELAEQFKRIFGAREVDDFGLPKEDDDTDLLGGDDDDDDDLPEDVEDAFLDDQDDLDD